MTGAAKAWLTRSGRYGERDSWALETGSTPGGFAEVPDLSACTSLDEVRAVVSGSQSEASPNAVGNFAAQLWALRGRMAVGDYVVLPLKSSPQQVAVGRITGEYAYQAQEADPDRRHVRPVDWLRTDVPRTAIKQDLLHSLGAFLTYCQVSRNEAAARIAAIAVTGEDPGSRVAATSHAQRRPPQAVQVLGADPEVPNSDESQIDLEEYAQDRIAALIQEEFSGHRLALLVEALLSAQGYTCWRAPEGADGGIDLFAGSGPLGLDPPQLVVQVKSEQGTVSDPVMSQLLGTMTRHGQSAQGLLVAWGGLTTSARRSARDNYFRLRVWTSSDVIAQVARYYNDLPEEIRTDLPLKQIWIAVEEQ